MKPGAGLLAVLAAGTVASSFGQTSPAFEVASVRQNEGGRARPLNAPPAV